MVGSGPNVTPRFEAPPSRRGHGLAAAPKPGFTPVSNLQSSNDLGALSPLAPGARPGLYFG